MSLAGNKQLQEDTPKGSGQFLKLEKKVPTQVTVIGYVGKQASKQFPDSSQYVFQINHDGENKRLGGSWRLAKALSEAADKANPLTEGPFSCVIVLTKDIEDIKGKDTLVNNYAVTDVKAVGEAPTDEIPF